jgi:hypothetical protein
MIDGVDSLTWNNLLAVLASPEASKRTLDAMHGERAAFLVERLETENLMTERAALDARVQELLRREAELIEREAAVLERETAVAARERSLVAGHLELDGKLRAFREILETQGAERAIGAALFYQLGRELGGEQIEGADRHRQFLLGHA